MKKNMLLILFIVCFFGFILGCGKGDVVAITVHNLDGRSFELGEEIDFSESSISVIYENGDKEVINITADNLDYAELLNVYTSLGEKQLTISYKVDGEVFTEDVVIYIVEKGYKTTLKEELELYLSDVLYSEIAKNKVEVIKMTYSNYISNCNSEEEGLMILKLAKNEIDQVLTIDEEESIYTLEELTSKVNELESKINVFVNYEDSVIKSEIEGIKEEIIDIKNNLKDDVLYNKIDEISLTLSAIESIVNITSSNVSENEKKIIALTELLNSVLSNFVSKEEINREIENITAGYLKAIEESFNNQKLISEIRVHDGYIEYRYNNSTFYEKLIAISELNSEVSSVDVNESGLILLTLDNEEVIETDTYVDVFSVEEIDYINSIIESKNTENIKSIIKAYYNNKYNINKYDVNCLEEILDEYYMMFIEFTKLTNYNVVSEVNNLHLSLNEYIDSDLSLMELDVIFNYEEALEQIDTTLDVVKAFFSSEISKLMIDEYVKEAFQNRILTTRSIESVIELYEEAFSYN